jgi:hypothetical protein
VCLFTGPRLANILEVLVTQHFSGKVLVIGQPDSLW